jgi:hypothetical protein
MRRPRLLSAIAVVVALVLALAACAGGDDEEASSRPAPAEAPSEGEAPPASPGQLPAEFVKCMAEQGFDVKSSADIHSAPPRVLQACFGALHQGGG